MAANLEIRVLNPAPPNATDGTPAVVLLHGRGADMDDLAPLRRWLPEAVALVLPRAPFPGMPWGYGPGWAWYRYAGEDRPEVESFRTAQSALELLLEGLAEPLGFLPGPVVLGGFSQGGTMSIGYALSRPGAVAGVLNFSGFLPHHPDVSVTPAAARATPMFWGHGTMDASIPFSMAEAGRARLREAGVQMETRDYEMGHGIAPDEMRDAMAWLEKLLGQAPST